MNRQGHNVPLPTNRPVALSPASRASLDQLIASSRILATELELAGDRFDDAAAIVRHRLGLAADGLARDDVGTALRGANLLTAVNKGVGDAAGGSEGDGPGARAFAVQRDAIAAAALLRRDAGMGW